MHVWIQGQELKLAIGPKLPRRLAGYLTIVSALLDQAAADTVPVMRHGCLKCRRLALLLPPADSSFTCRMMSSHSATTGRGLRVSYSAVPVQQSIATIYGPADSCLPLYVRSTDQCAEQASVVLLQYNHSTSHDCQHAGLSAGDSGHAQHLHGSMPFHRAEDDADRRQWSQPSMSPRACCGCGCIKVSCQPSKCQALLAQQAKADPPCSLIADSSFISWASPRNSTWLAWTPQSRFSASSPEQSSRCCHAVIRIEGCMLEPGCARGVGPYQGWRQLLSRLAGARHAAPGLV